MLQHRKAVAEEERRNEPNEPADDRNKTAPAEERQIARQLNVVVTVVKHPSDHA